jgi:phosphoribosylglycinamide formyltransferase 1
MGDLINLAVDLDERFADDAPARRRIEHAGYTLTVDSADDRTLAWIDEVFGGAWSSEAAVATTAVAKRDGAPAGFAVFDPKGLRFRWLQGMAREPGVGVFGPFGVDPMHRGGVLGPALLEIAMCGLRERGYRRALIGATNEQLAPYYERYTGARVAESYDPRSFTPRPVRTVVLASGSGTNFQAVIDRVERGMPLELAALVCNKPDAFASERARRAGIPAIVLPWVRAEQTREQYDAALLHAVVDAGPELVLLLGWMHLLAPAFVEAFPEMLNVHPAFLPLDPSRDCVGRPDGTVIPAFRGARAVRDALTAGSEWVGASVHEVTMETDRGRVLVRKPLHVQPGEDEGAVLARLHPIEHEVVARAVYRWLFERGSEAG